MCCSKLALKLSSSKIHCPPYRHPVICVQSSRGWASGHEEYEGDESGEYESEEEIYVDDELEAQAEMMKQMGLPTGFTVTRKTPGRGSCRSRKSVSQGKIV